MSFEEQKKQLIKLSEDLYDYEDDYENPPRYDIKLDNVINLQDLIKQLKPDYPTCSTCKYSDFYGVHSHMGNCNSKNDNNTDSLNISRDFGCIYHSELDINNV